MRKNVPNCCLTFMKYKNAKKVKWDRPTDQQSDLKLEKKKALFD